MESILQEIFQDIALTEKEIQHISRKLEKVTLKKKAFLIKAGQKINDIHYIHSGCLRTYFNDASGKEHTLQFAIKGWWISDYIALFGNPKSNAVCNIECLQEATLVRIPKKDFDALCNEIPVISRFYIQKLEAAFAAFQQRILANLTLSAKERYIGFVNAYPDIEQSVKNYHIASFLGVTTESLSRIRKEIASV